MQKNNARNTKAIKLLLSSFYKFLFASYTHSLQDDESQTNSFASWCINFIVAATFGNRGICKKVLKAKVRYVCISKSRSCSWWLLVCKFSKSSVHKIGIWSHMCPPTLSHNIFSFFAPKYNHVFHTCKTRTNKTKTKTKHTHTHTHTQNGV